MRQGESWGERSTEMRGSGRFPPHLELEKRIYCEVVARLACKVQRRVLVLIQRVDVGTHLHQRVSDVLAPGCDAAVVERRALHFVRFVDGSATCQQRAHHLRVAFLGGDVQRGLALCVGRVHVGALAQQQLHHPALAVQCGQVQRREVVAVVRVSQALVQGLPRGAVQGLPRVVQHGSDALRVPEKCSVHDGREAVYFLAAMLSEHGVCFGPKQHLGRHRVADLAGEHQGRLAVFQRLVDLLGVEGFHQLLDHAEGAHCREAMGVRA